MSESLNVATMLVPMQPSEWDLGIWNASKIGRLNYPLVHELFYTGRKVVRCSSSFDRRIRKALRLNPRMLIHA